MVLLFLSFYTSVSVITSFNLSVAVKWDVSFLKKQFYAGNTTERRKENNLKICISMKHTEEIWKVNSLKIDISIYNPIAF